MNPKKKKYIRYSKERVVLSDVLPYEVPIIFSNRYFYRFLVNNKVELKGNKITFFNKYLGSDSEGFTELLKLLFNIPNVPIGQDFVVETVRTPGRCEKYDRYALPKFVQLKPANSLSNW